MGLVANLRQAGADYGNGSTQLRGNQVLDSERYRELERRQSYFECRQHDAKGYDFDGRILAKSEMNLTTPGLSSEKAPWFVPLRQRRPSNPMRIGRVIVDAFTTMIFGDVMFPQLVVHDPKSQDFMRTCSRVGALPARCVQARNYGGGMGSVGLAWCFYKGKPRFTVHNAKNLYVHEWEDREQLIPRHVSEVYLSWKDEPDPRNNNRLVRNWYWNRRDWTPEDDIIFKKILYEAGKDPDGQWVPSDKSFTHNDGVTHFEWVQNIPSDDIDGIPDYEGLYENMDELDVILSVISRGAKLNLDPTLILKMDGDRLVRAGVKKGSDQALAVGKEGDAHYLELGGTSIDAGIKLFEAMRRQILEVAQCIVPDPAEVAAQGVSSLAIKAMFRPMMAKAGVIKEQYGRALERMLTNMLIVAQNSQGKTVTRYDSKGNATEVPVVFDLPPLVEKEPVLDEDGAPTGEDKVKLTEREPGEGEEVELVWPDPFPLTPTDRGTIATALTAATAGAAFMSNESAAEEWAKANGRDGREEWKRIQKAGAQAEAKQAEMFADHDGEAGGKVEHEMQLPEGSTVRASKGPKPKPPPMPKMPGMPGAKSPGVSGPPGGGEPDEGKEKPPKE